MRPRNKLFAQMVVALISMLYGFVIPGVTNPFDHNPSTNWIEFPLWVGVPLTLLWYVGMMNAINFIDGLDGLLAGVAAISSIFHLRDFGAARQSGRRAGRHRAGGRGARLSSVQFQSGADLSRRRRLALHRLRVRDGLDHRREQDGDRDQRVVPLLVLALPVLDTAAAIVRRAARAKASPRPIAATSTISSIFRFGLNVRQAVLLIYAVCFVLGAVALAFSGEFTHVFRHALDVQ